MSSQILTAFVDGDDTLFKVKHLDGDEEVPEGWTEVAGTQHRLAAIARPSARPFLIALGEKCDRVDMLTGNLSSTQNHVLKALGLRQYIGRIEASNNSDRQTPIDGPWVLVDNMYPGDEKILPKFTEACGAEYEDTSDPRFVADQETYFVHCEPFEGEDDPQSLMDLLPKIEKKFQAQAHDFEDD